MKTERPGTPVDRGKVDEPGGEAVGGRDTMEATAANADNAREGGRHWVENGEGRGRRPSIKSGRQFPRSGRRRGGARGLQSDTKPRRGFPGSG